MEQKIGILDLLVNKEIIEWEVMRLEELQGESAESMVRTQKLEHQMELIAKLVNGEDITRNRAFEIMNINNDFHDFVEFLKILEIWEEKSHEQNNG